MAIQAQSINTVERWDLDDVNIPENSVAVLQLTGVIWSYDSIFLYNQIKRVESNPNIIAILLVVNTPGGVVFHSDITSKAISECRVPVVSYVMNLNCSAGYFITCGSSKIYVSSPMDEVGSIGTKCNFTDWQGLFEKFGIKQWEVYATKSTRKDEEIRELLKENGSDVLIKKRLDYVNEIFHKTVRDTRGIAEDSEVFSGAVYNPIEAQSFGLIDGVKEIHEALQEAHELGLSAKIKSMY
jgi:ClpP class serine protease